MPLGQAAEFWPVGWPAEEKDVDLLPKLFDYLEAEITDTPLSEVLEAVQARLGVPLLLDRPALARRNIRLDQVRVSLAARRTYYKRVLDQSLSKARLKAQLRVDEAGQPLLWVSSMVP